MKRFTLLALCCLLTAIACARKPARTTLIMQVTDPQMGFYHDNRDMEYEIATLGKTVEAINRLRPDAVIFTGDLVHNAKDEAQWAKFSELIAGIDPAIKIAFLPGNHDVKIDNGSVDTAPYTRHIGADHFSFRVKGALLTGFNSVYLKNETADPQKELTQWTWLERSLAHKKRKELSLVFDHHPFFLERIDEAEGYSTLSPEKRQRYFELFDRTGVHTLFAGHLHDNAAAASEGVGMITTSAIGRPLGAAPSGVRIIRIAGGNLEQRYYAIEELPMTRQEFDNGIQ